MANGGISLFVSGIPGVRRSLDNVSAAIHHRTLLNKIGNFIQTRIKVRTSEGRDVDGRSFKPYSPKYKLFREKAGHPGNTVNLTFTGSMLASMNYSINTKSGTVRVFFQNTSDKFGAKNPEKAFFLNEEREFFALSSEDNADIVDIVDDYLRSVVTIENSRR